MIPTTLRAGSALVLLFSTTISIEAATCTMTATGFSCDAPDSAPIFSAENGVAVAVESGASVVSADGATPAIALEGDGVSVVSAGRIVQSDIRDDGVAILGRGDGLSVVNSGTISSGDRAIVMEGGSNLSVVNQAGATIEARRETIRAQEDSPGARIENFGTIRSSEGRVLQLRSFGATIFNYGDLIGGAEVVEGRGDFFLENRGNIFLNDPSIVDEDGVQFAGGEVQNFGSITGSDDGIDVDEGKIENAAGAVIRSTAPDANDNSGIDIDPVFDDGINPLRAPGPLEIFNAGLIEGPSAIGSDEESASEVAITNTGTLLGRGGTAVRFSEIQGDSVLNLSGESRIFGDVFFGAGDDIVTIAPLTSGILIDGFFDGRLGRNTVIFDGIGLGDLRSFALNGDQVDLLFFSGADRLTGEFRNFGTWVVEGRSFSAAELADEVGLVPVPAGLPLLLSALGGIAWLRRRR